VESAKIPVVRLAHSNRRRGIDPLQLALHGGDDYELLFTVPRRLISRIPKSFQGVRLTAIGEITKSKKLLLIHGNGQPQPLLAAGWDPFR
jgi:thiamine-monophosphate kinase